MLDRTKNETSASSPKTSSSHCRTRMLLDGRVSSYPASATGLFGDELLPAAAARRRVADRHRLRRRRAGAARADRIADRRDAAALAAAAAAERVHVDPEHRSVHALLQRQGMLHRQSRRGVLVRLRRRLRLRAEHARQAQHHHHRPRGDDPDRQSRPSGRRLPGADPADRHALDLRRGDQDDVHLRHVHPHLARPAGRPLDHPGRRRRSDRLRPRALVPAQHPLLVAGGRRHREAAPRHRQDPEQARHRDASRRATAASCAARRRSRST